MSLLSILETLLIGPLKLAFEFIFEYANRFTGHPGLSIVCLSLLMNVLVLPLYRRADAMQEQARDTEAKLHDGVAHIKKTFSGDERMMMLQTYYRQNHYKPTDALNGSVSLLLEIPFFIAAYQFLSHLALLEGVELGPIRDLSQPDALLTLGGLSVNVLPLLMTGINLLSGAIYLKGFPAKAKVQLYTMAGLFLVLLYRSPSGLVFYWTLNNLFSLAKNIFYKMKDPRRVLRWLCAGAGVALAVFGLFFYETDAVKRKIILAVLGLLLCLPLALAFLRGKRQLPARGTAPVGENKRIFLLACLFLTVLVGLLIPSEYIADSPLEFVDVSHFYHPFWFFVYSFCMAAGTFLIWLRVFYWLAGPKGKRGLLSLTWLLCGGMLVNYLFFGTDLGNISALFQYDSDISFTQKEILGNVFVLGFLALVMLFIEKKHSRLTAPILAVCVAVSGIMAGGNASVIKRTVELVELPEEIEMPSFQLSKSGKNVVFVLLDRAMGEFIPYLFQEKPELEEQFSGFTYYENTISFGGFTRFGIVPLIGGYEYTPVEMNKRSNETLLSKHNEAMKVLPVSFLNEGYSVTICNPAYSDYKSPEAFEVYDDYQKIKQYYTDNLFSNEKQAQAILDYTDRNIFCFSIMKTLPLFMQPTIYDHGLYHRPDVFSSNGNIFTGQVDHDENYSIATGLEKEFMNEYLILDSLPEMTEVLEGESNTFLWLYNYTAHEPMLLQEPDYVPSQVVDNTVYDEEHAGRFALEDGRALNLYDIAQLKHYQVNMAAMLKLGEWFDSLREAGVYDNTRIILAADHGRDLYLMDELIFGEGSEDRIDAEYYYPLLMVKDFNSEGFTVSDEFMTNADVPVLAMDGLIEEPVNPFTGKPITNDEKTAHDQFIILSEDFQVREENDKVFSPSKWASVKDNIWDPANWTFYNEETVLKEHAFP